MAFKKLIKEHLSQLLTEQEQIILKNITDNGLISEAVSFPEVLAKVKAYAKKGLITASIITALMSSSAYSQEQKVEIKNAAQIETVDNKGGGETMSAKQLAQIVKKDNYQSVGGGLPINMLTGKYQNFKIFKGVGQTQANASQAAQQNAGGKIGFKSQQYVRTLSNGNIEVLLVVPIQ